MKTHAGKILEEAAKTFTERRSVYGDNYLLVGQVMKGFFPEGLTLRTADDFNRFHIFMLTVVKQTRYVINWDKRGHQDSIHDQVVYDAMLEAIDANGAVDNETGLVAKAGRLARKARATKRRVRRANPSDLQASKVRTIPDRP